MSMKQKFKTIKTQINKDIDYIILDKTCLNDKRLSGSAKGIYHCILALPGPDEISVYEIAKYTKENKKFISKDMEELEKFGYIAKSGEII